MTEVTENVSTLPTETKSFNGLRIKDPGLNGWIIEKEYGVHIVYHPDKPKSLVKLQNMEQCLFHIFEMTLQEVQGEYTLQEYDSIVRTIHAKMQGKEAKA